MSRGRGRKKMNNRVIEQSNEELRIIWFFHSKFKIIHEIVYFIGVHYGFAERVFYYSIIHCIKTSLIHYFSENGVKSVSRS